MAIDFSKYGSPTSKPTSTQKTGTDFSKYGTFVDKPVSDLASTPQKSNFLTSQGPSFEASLGGSETILPNIGKTLGNIPSSARDLTKAAIAPVNPFDLESPLNIGASASKIATTATEIFKKQGFKQGTKNIGEGFKDTYLKVGEVIYGGIEKAYNAFLDDPEKAMTVTSDYIAQKAIEDPLFIPSLVYGGGKIKGKDSISGLSSPVTRGADTSLATMGQKTLASGENQLASETADFVRDLVRPVQNKAAKEAQVSRTTESGWGPFKKSEIAPSNFEQRMEQAVLKVPGVSPSKTQQQNFNLIRDYNVNLAKELEAKVDANDFPIPRRESKARLTKAKESLSESPLIIGDAEKTAQKLLDKAFKIIDENKGSAKGILKARKNYDAWVLTQKPKAFDAKSENAFSIANQEIRQTFNKLLEEKAPDAGTKASFAEQTALYNALDNIKPKAALEADTAIGRAMQRIGNTLGTKNRVVQMVAAAVGIGGLGAAATFAPIVAYAGIPVYLTYRAGKLVLKPQVRTALGRLLNEAGSELLPADALIISNILKEYSEPRTLTDEE